MATFFVEGESKTRPGVYVRFSNRAGSSSEVKSSSGGETENEPVIPGHTSILGEGKLGIMVLGQKEE